MPFGLWQICNGLPSDVASSCFKVVIWFVPSIPFSHLKNNDSLPSNVPSLCFGLVPCYVLALPSSHGQIIVCNGLSSDVASSFFKVVIWFVPSMPLSHLKNGNSWPSNVPSHCFRLIVWIVITYYFHFRYNTVITLLLSIITSFINTYYYRFRYDTVVTLLLFLLHHSLLRNITFFVITILLHHYCALLLYHYPLLLRHHY